MKRKQNRREFVRVLFLASQAAAASRFLPSNLFASDASAPSSSAPFDGINFLVFGDWGRRGQVDQVHVAEQMAKAAKQSDARFVIAVGDNFYEGGVASTEDKHWRESFENVYSAPSLQIPWYVILGNHDYYGNCEAQLAYSKISSRWRMPARYFVQTHQIDPTTTADFFYLDTTPMIPGYRDISTGNMRTNVLAQDVPAQLAWFKRSLEASKAQWKIVFGHHPIYSGSARGGTPELVECLLPLLREHKVQAYINGHDHDLQHLVAGKLHLFGSGAGSIVSSKSLEMEYTKFARNTPGFIAASLRADKLSVRMIDGSGTSVHNATVSRVPTDHVMVATRFA
jgi:tartrate-resistant acid phosphatase type 5